MIHTCNYEFDTDEEYKTIFSKLFIRIKQFSKNMPSKIYVTENMF